MTQHHHTPPPDPMPLDPEERALAARLARLGPHGEPSPALDARVLAAAHAATTGIAHDAARERGWRRARWPVGVGVAASVALAAGIAWQMRPLPAPVFAPTASTEVPAATTAAAKAIAPPPEAPRVVFDAPSPVAVEAPTPQPSPMPPPPPRPAPPAPPAPASAAADALPASAAFRVLAAPAPAPPADADEDATDAADAPDADVPPATAASPQVRDAWLARIRELAADGRADEARASLAEFRHRYPAFAIPDDLRPLLPPEPPPAPTR